MTPDPFQRAVLAELGLVLYRPSGTVSAPGDDAVMEDVDMAMLARLAQAVGLTPDALLAHADIAVQSSRLHGDAAAKRALWPRLRALRAGRG